MIFSLTPVYSLIGIFCAFPKIYYLTTDHSPPIKDTLLQIDVCGPESIFRKQPYDIFLYVGIIIILNMYLPTLKKDKISESSMSDKPEIVEVLSEEDDEKPPLVKPAAKPG